LKPTSKGFAEYILHGHAHMGKVLQSPVNCDIQKPKCINEVSHVAIFASTLTRFTSCCGGAMLASFLHNQGAKHSF